MNCFKAEHPTLFIYHFLTTMCVKGVKYFITVLIDYFCYFIFTDSRGSFQLRTKEEVEKIKQEKEEMAKKREQTAWLGGSILDRHTRVPNNPNALIRLPENYRMDSVAEKDLTTSSNAPTSFDVPVIQVNNGEASRGTKHDENDNERLVASNSLLVPDRVSIEYKDDEEAVPAASTSSGSPFSMAVPVISVSNDNKAVTILLSKKRTSLGKGLFILRNLGKTSVFIFELIHGT